MEEFNWRKYVLSLTKIVNKNIFTLSFFTRQKVFTYFRKTNLWKNALFWLYHFYNSFLYSWHKKLDKTGLEGHFSLFHKK